MKKIKVGGVPEHFNYPWHYGIENHYFSKENINIDWQDIKGGSGAMCKMLENDGIDLALVLTEGIVKHIHSGSKAKIVQQYVKSPLIWGVHCSNHFYKQQKSFEQANFARSRVGSGSHIMAFVHAEQNNYRLEEENFITVGNIDGAVEGFNNKSADLLLWEKFMTQPLIDAGKMRRIGECISPWPCFVLVASEKFISENNKYITPISETIIMAAETVMKKQNTVKEISERYKLELNQVEQWYSIVEWQTSDWISSKMLNNVVTTLTRVGLLQEQLKPENMCLKNAKLY